MNDRYKPYRSSTWTNSYEREDSWRSSSPQRRRSRPSKRHQNGSSHSGGAKRSRSSSASKKGIQMLVTSNDFPAKHLTDEQLELLQGAILGEISKIAADDFSPQFLDSFKRRGNLIIMCNNQESVDWLKKTIPDLKPWEDANLKTLEPSEVPNLVDISIILQGKVDVEIFLRRIDKQNENINANTWNLISKKEDEDYKNTTLTFSVEEAIAETIKKASYKIFYNFTRLYVKHLGSLKSKDEKKSEKKSEEKEKPDDESAKKEGDIATTEGDNATTEGDNVTTEGDNATTEGDNATTETESK